MPELPEVETTVRAIEPILRNNSIASVEILRENMIKDPRKLLQDVVGRAITSVERKGKYMIVRFDAEVIMVIHLKISGRLGVRTARQAALKYERIRFVMNDGTLLVFNDPRTLGRVYVFPNRELDTFKSIVALGPDALTVSSDELYRRLQHRRIPVKQALLDQSFIAGVGNIYADEACFDASIDPRRLAFTVTEHEADRLGRSIAKVLNKGIANMGTSISDFADLFGKPGQNQSSLLAYGRAGQPCVRCEATLERVVIASRGTTFCAHCQV